MKPPFFLIIDFDSTVIQVEALDELAEISLENYPDKNQRKEQIRLLTNLGMEGKLEFPESLKQRICLLNAHRDDLKQLIRRLHKKISVSFIRNIDFFRNHADSIYIVSGGFREFICPIIQELGLKPENVYANNFVFDNAGNIIGFDKKNIMGQKDGKVALLKMLNLDTDIYVIGDGYTDYQIKSAGLANKFFAFTENIHRDNVVQAADHITPSFDEFLYLNKLPMAISYPKNRINVLLAGKIPAETECVFQNEGYNVQRLAKNFSEEMLFSHLNRTSILSIGPDVRLPKNWLQQAPRLMAVGAFSKITPTDPQDCLDKGIAIFQENDTNSRNIAELALAAIIFLQRRIPHFQSIRKIENFETLSQNNFTVSGKKLGIIGYGRVGSQLSVLAEMLGMDVYFFDIQKKSALGRAHRCLNLNTLLQKSDFISIHVNTRSGTDRIIDEKKLQLMRKNSLLLNFSHGDIIDLSALKNSLIHGEIQGAALVTNSPDNYAHLAKQFSMIPNVILTPTAITRDEKQSYSVNSVPNQIIDYINTGSTIFSTNFPGLKLPALQDAHRLIHIHQNIPGMLAHINNILAAHNTNIVGQYLKTNERVGYVITDISKEYEPKVIEKLRNISHTIKFRILY